MSHLLQDTNFWYFVAFAIFFILVGKKIKTALYSLLDEHSNKIRLELERATRLREEAQAHLAEQQRRHHQASGEAQAIIAHAQEEAVRLKATALEELEKNLALREQLAVGKILQAQTAALASLREYAANLTTQAALVLLQQHLGAEAAASLQDAAIAELPQKFH
jgi:F-type H+-transporting ATPase subunit b